MTIRPQVIDLLTRIDGLDPHIGPAHWTIDGGRPLTDQERTLALSASREELEAMLALSQATLETMTAEVDTGHQLLALLDPYWSDPDLTVTQVIATLPADKRAQAEQLLRGLPQWLEIPRP